LIASIMTDADPEGYTYEIFAKTPYENVPNYTDWCRNKF